MSKKSIIAVKFVRLILFSLTCCYVAKLPAWADGALIPSSIESGPLGGSRVTGKVTEIGTSALQLSLRNGQTVAIDLRTAAANHLVPPLYIGEFVQVQGSLAGSGTMTANAVARAKSAPATWSADIP